MGLSLKTHSLLNFVEKKKKKKKKNRKTGYVSYNINNIFFFSKSLIKTTQNSNTRTKIMKYVTIPYKTDPKRYH